MKSADFLEKYHTLLFDMDGVITSEQGYWYSAALTVYERLFSGFSAQELMEHHQEIFDRVFLSGSIITNIKNLGVNTNWDLAYIVLIFCMVLQKRGVAEDKLFQEAGAWIASIEDKAPRLYRQVAKLLSNEFGYSLEDAYRLGPFWSEVQALFQQWYLGEDSYIRLNRQPIIGLRGKTGLIHLEEPLVPLDRLKETLAALCQDGKRLGIGTGRPAMEIELPLKKWGIYEYFNPNAIVTYTTVSKAHDAILKQGMQMDLAKPHPYMFIKGALGLAFDDVKIARGEYVKNAFHQVLVVGDAGSDILAAQGAKMDFAAVLTGIAGQNAKQYFLDNHATYILNNVLELACE